MRIIAGMHRGKKLVEYYTSTTRPTTDRVKENVFNVLGNYVNLAGARVLDLFAGTGAYGIECLSRGAGYVHFNDYDPAAVQVIKKNIGNLWRNYKITQQDYCQVLDKTYDIIFLDPPYATDFGVDAIAHIKSGWIVFETEQEFSHPAIVTEKKYGRARIYILKK